MGVITRQAGCGAMGSMSGLGPGGCRFESGHPDDGGDSSEEGNPQVEFPSTLGRWLMIPPLRLVSQGSRKLGELEAGNVGRHILFWEV